MAKDKDVFPTPESQKPSPEKDDEKNMEKLVAKVKNILFTAAVEKKIKEQIEEAAKKQEVLMKGKEILEKISQEEIEFLEQRFEEFLEDSHRREQMFDFLEKQYGWTRSETWAMFGVLRHALMVFYYYLDFEPPDEKSLQKGIRDLKSVAFEIIKNDYSPEWL